VTVFTEHLLENDLGTLDVGGIVLAFDGERNLLLLEAIEDVRYGDGAEALVVDLADGGLFTNVDDELGAALAGDLLDAEIVEVAGVPEGVEVSLNDGGVVLVAGAREETCEDGLLGDAAIANDLGLTEDLGSCGGGKTRLGHDLSVG
jgi:hypothetical protein